MAESWDRYVRELVEPRGWMVSICANNHLKCTHPKVPEAVFTSGTPSDVKTRVLFRTKIARAERAAGLTPEPDNGRLSAEDFPVIKTGDRVFIVVTCQNCGTSERRKSFVDSPNRQAFANVRHALRKLGWAITRKRIDDRCPSCIGKKVVRIAAAKSESSIRLVASAADYKTYQAEHGNKRRSEITGQRRRIFRALDKAYSVTCGGYIAGESDEAVAGRCKVEVALVAAFREEHFGPALPTSAWDNFRADILALGKDVGKIQDAIIDSAAAMEARYQSLMRKAAALEAVAAAPIEAAALQAMNGKGH